MFVLDGFSKRYAMTGFRLGFAIVPAAALRPLQVMQQNLFISANHFVQRAGVAALEHGEATRRGDARRLRAPRAVCSSTGLRKLGFEIPVPPAGAFYVFADARRFGSDSRRLAFDLLERAHVAVTPGIDFGAAGEGFLRFSLSAPDAQIEEALVRLGARVARGEDPRRASRRDRRCARRLPARQASPRSRSSGARTSASRACSTRWSGARRSPRTSSTPGKTRLAHFFLVERDVTTRSARRVLLVDLPGYGWAKVAKTERAAWQKLVECYLGGPRAAAPRDPAPRRAPRPDRRRARSPRLARRARACRRSSRITKSDKLAPMRRAERVKQLVKDYALAPEAMIATSAEKKDGIDALWRAIDERLA